MKTVFVFAALFALHAQAAQVSPVQKVIELLENLKGKVADDLAAEEAEMVEYSKYCDDESSERKYAIEQAGKAIERLNAAIEDGNAEAAAAQQEIESMSSDAAHKETELNNAMKLRGAEKGDFKKTEGDLQEADDQLHAAEVIVKREMSFVQLKGKQQVRKMSPKGIQAITAALSKVIDSTSVNAKSKSKLEGFMQAAESDEDKDLTMQTPLGAPEADNYENHSGGILGTIKDLEVKDEDQLSATRKQEMQNQHAYDLMRMSLEDAISLLKKKIDEAKAEKSALQEQAAAAEGEKAETEKTKAADEAFLQGLTTDCTQAAKNWEARKADAAAEMGAIDKAKEILATGVTALFEVKSVEKKSLKRDDGDSDSDAAAEKEDQQRSSLQKILKELGHKYNSMALLTLSGAAANDPFAKIKGLINDMVTKLMDEAAQEADQKAFCDEEQAKSRKSSAEKSRKMDQTKIRIDEAASTKAGLQEAVKELEGEIAGIDSAQAEATKIRNEEHATYLQASSDYKQSADAVEKAMAVLSDYYGKSFVQLKTKKNKQPAFGSKTGGDTASTIISILEVSAEDFTKMLAETEANEAEASAGFKQLSDDNRISKASKTAEIKGKTSEIKSLTVALSHHNEDYKSVSKEYDAVMAYLDKLKPECESKVMSYAEKKARREAEIAGLQDALEIIEGRGVPSVELIQRHH